VQQADLLEHLAAAIFSQPLHCHDASVLSCAFFFLHFAFLLTLVRRKSINASGWRMVHLRLARPEPFVVNLN